MTPLEIARRATAQAFTSYLEHDPDSDPDSDLNVRVDVLVAALANFASLTAKDEINFHNRTTTPAA